MQDQLTLTLTDGSVLSAWDSFSVVDDYADPVGSMEFVASPPHDRIGEYARRLKKGEAVIVKVNGVPQSSGLITTVHTKLHRQGGAQFFVKCKGILCTMHEGAVVPPDFSFRSKTDTPVSNVILQVAKPYGFLYLEGDERKNRSAITGRSIGNQGPPLPVDSLKHHEAQAHENEKAYDLCARIVTRLGVTLRSTWNAQLMLSRPNYDQAASYAVAHGAPGVQGADYFLDGCEIEDTNDHQFSDVTVRGQAQDKHHATRSARPIAKYTSQQLQQEAGADQRFTTYLSSVSPFKPDIITDKHSRDIDRCTSVAKLAVGMPARKAYVLTGEVAGLAAKTGAVWNVDTIVSVYIPALNFTHDMWILKREFLYSRKNGPSTKLTIIPKGFFVIGNVPK